MWWRSRRKPGAEGRRVPAVLYTRAACPLCDEMKAELLRAGVAERCELRIVDVDGDPALVRLHGDRVPVLEVGGRLAFAGRIRGDAPGRRIARLERTFHLRGPAARECEPPSPAL